MYFDFYINSLSHLFDIWQAKYTQTIRNLCCKLFLLQFLDVVLAEHGKVLGSQLVRTHLRNLDEKIGQVSSPLSVRAGFWWSEKVFSLLAAPASASLPPQRDFQSAKSHSGERRKGNTGTRLASNGCPTSWRDYFISTILKVWFICKGSFQSLRHKIVT